MLRNPLVVVGAAACIALTAGAVYLGAIQQPEAKLEDIRRLLTLTESQDLGMQAFDLMLDAFRKSMPQVPAQFWNEYRAEARASDLLGFLIPVYDRHLTHEEVKELIKFYESPIGRKMVKVTPAIMQESMFVGQQWGREMGERLKKRLEEKGYKKVA